MLQDSHLKIMETTHVRSVDFTTHFLALSLTESLCEVGYVVCVCVGLCSACVYSMAMLMQCTCAECDMYRRIS